MSKSIQCLVHLVQNPKQCFKPESISFPKIHPNQRQVQLSLHFYPLAKKRLFYKNLKD